MANNRLYLRCNSCGDAIMLGKHFGGTLYRSWKLGEMNFTDALNDFYDDHYYCSDSGRAYHLELCEEFPCEMTDNPIDSVGMEIGRNEK